jgi:CTP:molybdopterin cytidylyltransferase MocA
MNFPLKHFSALILAGGLSSRMGTPKCWLRTNSGQTFLMEIINSFKALGIESITVVLNARCASPTWVNEMSDVGRNAKIILNNEAQKGRMHSCYLGLEHIQSDYVFIQNVDNPLVDVDTLKYLHLECNSDGITIPSYRDKGGHPVIISPIVRAEIVNKHTKHQSLKELFSQFDKKYVEVDNKAVLANINTKHDFEIAFNEPLG